jgi:hypothetical protein
MPTKFSYSQYSAFLKCPKSYYWAYIKGLVPKVTPKALAIGTAFHEGLSGQGEAVSTWHQIGMLARKFWPAPSTHQLEVSKELDLGLTSSLIVIADEVSPDRVIEYKTASKPDSDWVSGMMLSNQLRLYCIAFSKPGAIIRCCKKADIRPRKNETDEQREARLLDEYIEKPHEYFLEIDVPVTHEQKAGTLKEFYQVFGAIQMCQTQGIWPAAAPHACSAPGRTCSYLPLCSDYEGNLALFTTKEEK